MNITKNTVVSLNYTLTNPEGEVLDTSKGAEPLVYLHGRGHLIPGLEAALEGKVEGASFKVTVPPSEGYGERDDELMRVATRDQFPSDAEISVGMQFQAEASGETQVVTVAKVESDDITLDFNHPLAGVSLLFDISVIEVRDATPEELVENDHKISCGPSCGPSCGCGD